MRRGEGEDTDQRDQQQRKAAQKSQMGSEQEPFSTTGTDAQLAYQPQVQSQKQNHRQRKH